MTIRLSRVWLSSPLIARSDLKQTPEEFYESVRPVLETGRTVSFYASGDSMRPFIHNGDVVRLVSSPVYRRGDVVMCITKEQRVVLHYIVNVDGDVCTLMGAANLKKMEQCRYESIIGKVEMPTVIRVALLIWHRILPVRRYVMWLCCRWPL